MKLLLTLWLRLIRSWKSPLLYWLFRKTIYRGKLPEKWYQVKYYNKYQFSNMLAQYDYKPDFLWGILDFSPEEKNFFFLKRNHNRDCDNWSRMWFWWAEDKGYPVWEVCGIKGWKIWTAHKLTIARVNEEYEVYNYTFRGSYSTFKQAVESTGYSVWAISNKGCYNGK